MGRFKNISLNIGHFIIFAIVFALMIDAASYFPIYGAISLLLLFPLYSSRYHINKTAIIILTYTSLILLSLAINVFVNLDIFGYIISFIIGLMGSIIWFIALIWSVKK